MPKKIFYKIVSFLLEKFWILPGAMVCIGVIGAVALIEVDRSGILPTAWQDNDWVYNGGGTGARTLLGAIASSTIGVAGTVFSITIAALSLAAGQMGPRLLRNFTQDRGNQITLGAFLATFSYALMVLRSVRTQEEGTFVPHLSLTVAIVLAFVCVGTLVYFVGHMANRINVDTVIELVSGDVHSTIRRLTTPEHDAIRLPEDHWDNATMVRDQRHGYLQHLDHDALADWANERDLTLKLLVRPGDYVFPGAPIALARAEQAVDTDAIGDAIVASTGLGPERTSSVDLEFAVRQLVEVAVRALSPGINDPHTAISVLDRLGAALCNVVGRELPAEAILRDRAVRLLIPSVDYDGLTDAMFHMIRQNASGSTAVLMRIIDVLTAVSTCEPRGDRRVILKRHAILVKEDAERSIENKSDLREIKMRYEAFSSKNDGSFLCSL